LIVCIIYYNTENIEKILQSFACMGGIEPHAAEPTAAPADGNVAAASHAQYVLTLTAAAACQ